MTLNKSMACGWNPYLETIQKYGLNCEWLWLNLSPQAIFRSLKHIPILEKKVECEVWILLKTWKMVHLLFRSKCFIFYNKVKLAFQSAQKHFCGRKVWANIHFSLIKDIFWNSWENQSSWKHEQWSLCLNFHFMFSKLQIF